MRSWDCNNNKTYKVKLKLFFFIRIFMFNFKSVLRVTKEIINISIIYVPVF